MQQTQRKESKAMLRKQLCGREFLFYLCKVPKLVEYSRDPVGIIIIIITNAITVCKEAVQNENEQNERTLQERVFIKPY